MPTIRAADGGYLLNANHFNYTSDEQGRPVLNVKAGAEGDGDFMADGSVVMTGALRMGGNAIYNVTSLSNSDEAGMAIESDVSMNNHKLSDLANPFKPQDAATKVYVDSKLNALLPVITTASEGKVLGVVDGKLAWVDKA